MSKTTTCPICGSAAQASGTRDYGERQQVECHRCGSFVITGTARAMFEQRLYNNPLGVARVSHAVRSRVSENKLFEINSTEVERLMNCPLPSSKGQLENLLKWIRREAGDELSFVKLPSDDVLSAIVGTSGPDNVKSLIERAQKEGHLELYKRHNTVRLLTNPVRSEEADNRPTPATKAQSEVKIEKGHCPDCGPERSSDVVASHCDDWAHETIPIWTRDIYMILKCRGCGATYLKHAHYFSEDEEYDTDPETGEFQSHIDPTITYWPTPSRRARPNWFDELKDRALKQLLGEVYLALDADQRVLAAIGIRTALDRAMVLLGADESDNFARKLNALQEKELISISDKEILLVLTDAGGAAAHRAWRPEVSELNLILDGAESFLHRTLVYRTSITAMQVPPRDKKNRS